MGFQHVYVMEEGIAGWIHANLPTDRGPPSGRAFCHPQSYQVGG